MSNKDNHISRRDFLKHTALGVVGAGIGVNGLSNLHAALGADGQMSSLTEAVLLPLNEAGL